MTQRLVKSKENVKSQEIQEQLSKLETEATELKSKMDQLTSEKTVGDLAEVNAIKSLFGDHAYKVPISSTKSSIGHLLGAAGRIEAIFSILALEISIVPPTLNLFDPSEGCDLNFVPFKSTRT